MKKTNKPYILWSIFRAFRFRFITGALLKLLRESLLFGGPLLLGLVIYKTLIYIHIKME